MCEKLLLTVVEAGALLGLKRSKLYQLLQTSRLRSVRIDGSRRVLVSDLHEFVQRLRDDADDGCA
jgi:excisionase family DNA binding protein